MTARPATTLARVLALATALVAFTALALQLGILAAQLGASAGLWRFLGYFTILTNLLTGIVAAHIAWGRTAGLAGPRMRLVTVTAIAFVGIVYSVALRGLWNPEGWQKVADVALHDATPLLFFATWIASGHGDLAWRDIGKAMSWPLAYVAYALLRGAGDGWYAYWFLDPQSQSVAELTMSIAVLALAFALLAAAFVWIDHLLGKRTARAR